MSHNHYLTVYNPYPYKKSRFGKNNDGGYIICDVGDNYDAFIGGGLPTTFHLKLIF